MTTDQLAVEMLLDDNQEGLTRLANNQSIALHVCLGDLCPLCGGKSVCVNGDEILCHDCEEIYDLPTAQQYDREGNVIDGEGHARPVKGQTVSY